ncbi:glycosyltransferase family 25 protein [Acinetobacter johnsonii]|uniref:Glycosyltransferase family 25 protein n=1 Tax=Acinetobacter johnsonii TaxID=40214 RepID=A0AA42MXE6_ACIJO|nr:glycosyltransferase family 25 protein [Acinetobacter johnsonii]MDH0970465.1 glycosyltransferase family 25 protein [Acinetobacter johnsonii]
MKIYLISLELDSQRRLKIVHSFPKNYPKMQWIKAVNGKDLAAKEYFFYIQKYLKVNKKLLTPSEVGCTLSHLTALENFLKTDDKYALIIEDDILGEDKDIDYLKSLMKKIDFSGVLLCGGQDGLNYWKYVLAKKDIDEVYHISKFSIKFLSRTCCYVVSRDFAEYLLKFHEKNLSLADDWYKILRKTSYSFLYLDILSHPIDLSNSHIESERSKFYEKSSFKRILEQGIFWKVYNRIRNDTVAFLLMLLGFKKIK